jgi:hypothetical protein
MKTATLSAEGGLKINLLQLYYGFENKDFVDNIANYKDLIHFSEKISDWIIRAIAVKKGLLTLDNIDEYLAACEQRAKEFDLVEMNSYVQNRLSDLP